MRAEGGVATRAKRDGLLFTESGAAHGGSFGLLTADAHFRWINFRGQAQSGSDQLAIEAFPGYKAVHVSKSQLDSIINRRVASWHAALSNVGGVYLVNDDETGKLYVGSATGAGGFWQRWSEYSASGHAGNVGLKALMCDGSPERYGDLRFSILEIADLAPQPIEVIARESHWKRVLMAREFGLCAD